MRTWSDLRSSVRTLAREPGFAAIAIVTVALGIGANTAIFSIVNGVLLRPLAYRNPERLVGLQEVIPAMADRYPLLPVSPRHFTEWRQRCTSFESLSALMPETVTLTGSGEAERVDAEDVSANLFDTLGVQPALGRGFVAGEDKEGSDRVAIITDSLWRRRFHSDPAIAGKTITLDTQPYTVAGVLPPSFRIPPAFALAGFAVGMQRPEILRPLVFPKGALDELMGRFNYSVVARLKQGVTRGQALAELNVIAAQLVKMSGEKLELRASVSPLDDAIVGSSRRGLLVLLGAVGSVLLIVCVNLANVALARGERRAHESAIRKALGAGRGQMLRQALTESLLIAVAGGALGVAAAAAGLGMLIRSAPADIPRLAEVSLDGRVLLFALAVTTATGLLFGLAPAWRAARAEPQSALKAGTRSVGGAGGLRLRGALVTAEVGLSAVLLVTSALLMSSFVRLLRADKGFRAPAVLAADVAMPLAKYGKEDQRNRFHQQLLAKLASQPGILSAAISTALPLQGEIEVDPVWLPGDTRPFLERPVVNVRFVSPDYLRTIGIPMLAGRAFSESDRTRKVAVISERVARALFPGKDPVGRVFERGGGDRWEVIGVAGDVRADADKQPVAMVYHPYWEAAPARLMLVARAAGDPRSIAGTMRAAVHSVDADVPLKDMRTMQEVLGDSMAQRRFQMWLATAFAVTALLLASLGIYGVVSYSVTRRTNEMGIRMALGAQAHDIYGMVLREAMKPVAVGLLAGVAGALAAGRILAGLLYEVSPRDPLAIGVVAVLLASVGLAACLLPARRATRVEPLAALRYE